MDEKAPEKPKDEPKAKSEEKPRPVLTKHAPQTGGRPVTTEAHDRASAASVASKAKAAVHGQPKIRNILAPNRIQVRGLEKKRVTTVDYLAEAKRKEKAHLAKKQAEMAALREEALSKKK